MALALVSVPGYVALRPDNAAEHHEAGVAYHLQRSLDEAAREYDQALRIDPPRPPPPEDHRRMLSLAPRVFFTAGEPFGLRDAAARRSTPPRISLCVQPWLTGTIAAPSGR